MYSSIHKKVVEFKKTGKGYRTMIDQIRIFAYNYPVTHWKWDDDRRTEFYLFFEPRIGKILNNFELQGVDFTHYISHCLSWQKRSFLAFKKRRQIRHTSYNDDISSESLFLQERRPSWKVNPLPDSGYFSMASPYKSQLTRKRILVLSLKSVLALTEEDLEAVALITLSDFSWLKAQHHRLYSRLMERRRLLPLYRRRRNTAYFYLLRSEMRLKEAEDPKEKEKWTRRVAYHRRSLISNQRQLSRIPSSPSNAEIAEVLRIPKGTVDSTLYSLKSYYPALYQSKQFDYSDSYGNTISYRQSAQKGRDCADPAPTYHSDSTGEGNRV